MESTTDKKQNPSDKETAKDYEARCDKLAGELAESLDRCEVGPPADLTQLRDRIQADLNLADFKFKFRQADHVHALLYGPYAISIATLVLSGVVVFGSVSQTQPKGQDTKASLILKVLEAPPGEGEHLLKFFNDTGLLKLEPTQQVELEELLRK